MCSPTSQYRPDPLVDAISHNTQQIQELDAFMRCTGLLRSIVLQVIGFHDARIPFGRTQVYSGMIHCFIIVCKEEGILGFYKGASVALIKVSSCYFMLHKIHSK